MENLLLMLMRRCGSLVLPKVARLARVVGDCATCVRFYAVVHALQATVRCRACRACRLRRAERPVLSRALVALPLVGVVWPSLVHAPSLVF